MVCRTDMFAIHGGPLCLNTIDGQFASFHKPTILVEQRLYHRNTGFAQEGDSKAMAFGDSDSTPCKNAHFAVVDSPVAP